MIQGTNEKVLCVPDAALKDLLPDALEYIGDAKTLSEVLSLVLQHHSFLDRDTAEYDPAWRQVIPYQIVQNFDAYPAEYLLITRTKKQTEERLHEKLSLGIGGHINPINSPTESVLTANMRREREEEIRLDVYTENMVGVIRSNASEVDRVHLGLVVTLGVRHTLEVREKENMTARWASVDEILACYDKLERWSQILANVLTEYRRL